MFLPIGQECSLRLSDGSKEEVVGVVGNRDRSLIALISATTVYIYNAQPNVLLCSYRQPETEVAEKGEFVRAYWQFDSIALAVTTKKSHLLIFSVSLDADERSYCLKEREDGEQYRSRLHLSKEGLPSVFLHLNVVVNTTSPIACAAPNRDELLICGSNGFVHHLQWNGKFDSSPSNCSSFQLTKIPFAHDQLQSKPAFLPDNSCVFIRDIAFAPLCGGYAIVLSDGRAALLTSNDHKFLPNTLLGVWASHLKDAVVTDTNHRFRSLLFGCANGDIVAFHVDDLSGALHQTFRVTLSVKNGPELSGRLGAVLALRVLPQNGAIAVVWESGGRHGRHAKSLPAPSTPSTSAGGGGGVSGSPSSTALTPLPPVCAVLSPMGSQWWCSLEGKEEERSEPHDADTYHTYHSVDWGPEGYQIWLGGSRGASLLEMTRSAAFGNPYMEHSNRIVLVGSQRIFISPLRSRESLATSPHSVWSAIDLRPEYLHANWPIRFVSLDRESGRTLVVAGSTGLSFCALSNQRWKIFGNESQERELRVTGGVFVWRGLMVGACAENAIKMYPIETRLDERFASTKETDARIIMSNMKGDTLVTMDVESRLLMYTLQKADDREGFTRAAIERTAEIRIGELVPHIACLVSIHLTVLTYDKAAAAVFVPGVDTVLLNISGRLYTLTPKAVTRDEADEEEENRFQLNQPATIASFVEQVWHDRAVERSPEGGDEDAAMSSPLHNALWINCGARGSHVWLPLLSGRTRSGTLPMTSAGGAAPLPHHHDSFLSRRIMIPFEMELNPALIASTDCIATGVEATPAVYGHTLTIYSPHRNGEVFIHHLLRQLLKRNLGMFALDLAESFRYLPYFKHSLELLLHNVLEEEATSAEPIPDPLLPRVVAFIQEFPEFLKTIAHCARKTELALWPALFEVTGAPNDLFEVCLRDGQLETAASYLIILQNIESAAVSLDQAVHLLREALTSCSWQLARDLVRFAKSIDAEDMESSPARSPPPSMTNLSRRASRGGNSKGAGAADELVLARFQAAGKVGRLRHSHSVSEAPPGSKDASGRDVSRKDSASKKVIKTQSSDLSPSSPHSPTSNGSAPNVMLERMNRMLHEHARGLLEEYCVRDLGCLCAHLEMDTPALLACISQLQSSSTTTMTSSPTPPAPSAPMRIADFSLALQRVHSQFEWPYPVPSSRVVEQLAKRFAGIKSSASTACLSDTRSDIAPPMTPSSTAASKKASREENSLLAMTPMPEVPADLENSSSSTSGEVVAVMERISGAPQANGGRDYRSGSPSSMMTSSGVATDDVSSLNGGGGLQMEPLLGPNEAVKGNEAREAQLRFMIGAFAEIAAMDWVFLLCVVLRDAAVARATLSVATGRRAGSAAMQRLRVGCRQLIGWAAHNCIGYVHILHVFDGHLSMLCEALGQADQAAPAAVAEQPVATRPPADATVAAAEPPAAAAQLLRSRALRDAFGSPGGAVRSTAAAPVTRARSKSVDRGAERPRERRMRVSGEEAVSNVAVQESADCSIM